MMKTISSCSSVMCEYEKLCLDVFVAAENVCLQVRWCLEFLLCSNSVSSSSQKLFREKSLGCSSDCIYQLSRIFFLKHLKPPWYHFITSLYCSFGRKFGGKFFMFTSFTWIVLQHQNNWTLMTQERTIKC